jgi:hypothetical protein
MKFQLKTVPAKLIDATNVPEPVFEGTIVDNLSGVTLFSDKSNKAMVFVGDETVSSVNGIPLAPGESVPLVPPSFGPVYGLVALQKIYVVGEAGSKVRLAGFILNKQETDS